VNTPGPWVRLDGVLVAQSKTDLLDGEIFGPINQDEYGTYLGSASVLTGTDSSGAWTAQDCDGWTSALSTEVGTTGRANSVTRWTDARGNPCDDWVRLICLSEVLNGPLVFFDGFESGGTSAWSATTP